MPVTCGACGNKWTVQLAHVVRQERTPDGIRKLVQCPKCGRVQSSLEPKAEENGD